MSREVNMTRTEEWYVEIAEEVKKRDRALNMIQRWQGKAAEAEQRIQELTQEHEDEPVAV
jgi:predicted transposase YdaD